MDIFSAIFNFITNQDAIIRIGLIILLALYGLFALIIAIQVNSLNKVVNQTGFSGILNVIAIVHFLVAIALLFFAVLFL